MNNVPMASIINRVPLTTCQYTRFIVNCTPHASYLAISLTSCCSRKIHTETCLNADRKLVLSQVTISFRLNPLMGERGSVVVKALCYNAEGSGLEIRWDEFLNLPKTSGRCRPWGLLSLQQKEYQKYKNNNVSGE
jgi:hypothetical protein